MFKKEANCTHSLLLDDSAKWSVVIRVIIILLNPFIYGINLVKKKLTLSDNYTTVIISYFLGIILTLAVQLDLLMFIIGYVIMWVLAHDYTYPQTHSNISVSKNYR